MRIIKPVPLYRMVAEAIHLSQNMHLYAVSTGI
jgi:hypothetical protein